MGALPGGNGLRDQALGGEAEAEAVRAPVARRRDLHRNALGARLGDCAVTISPPFTTRNVICRGAAQNLALAG